MDKKRHHDALDKLLLKQQAATPQCTISLAVTQ